MLAAAEPLKADELSDKESAAVATDFYTINLKKVGSAREIVGTSRFARQFPDTIERATARMLKERRRRIKAEEKMAIYGRQVSRLEQDLAYERGEESHNMFSQLRRQLVAVKQEENATPEDAAREIRSLKRENQLLTLRLVNYEKKVISLQRELARYQLGEAPLKSRQRENEVTSSAHVQAAMSRAAKHREIAGRRDKAKRPAIDVSGESEASVGTSYEAKMGSTASSESCSTCSTCSATSSSGWSFGSLSDTAVQGSPPRQ